MNLRELSAQYQMQKWASGHSQSLKRRVDTNAIHFVTVSVVVFILIFFNQNQSTLTLKHQMRPLFSSGTAK